MKKTVAEIIKSSRTAQSEHDRFRQLYDDVYAFGMPGRYNNITEVKNPGEKRRERIFSSVFEESCDEFVQRFQSLICPVNTDWIDFEAGYMFNKDNADAAAADKELSKIAAVLNTYKNTSNFDTAFTEMCYDVIAGTGVICALEGTAADPFRFQAIPFVDICMSEGADGSIDAYYRRIKIKNAMVERQWEGAKFEYEKGRDDDEAELQEVTYYDYDDRIWRYVVIDGGKERFVVEREYKTSPFIDLRWSKCAGETYGRGPGLKVIADVKTHNEIKKYSMQALAFTIPTFMASTDGGYNPDAFALLPGAINPVPSTNKQAPTVAQLEVNPMPDLANYNMEKLEMDIKKSMFASTIPNDPDPKMTATEVARRVEELDNSLNNSFGRLLEFLYRLTRRMLEIAQRFNYVSPDLDVNAFNGYGFKVRVNTQLANQQTRKEVADIIQSLQMMAQFDPNFTMISKAVDIEHLLPYLLDKMGVPNKYLRTPDEIRQLQMQEQQAMAAQQQQMIDADVAASNEKEQGKADAAIRQQAANIY